MSGAVRLHHLIAGAARCSVLARQGQIPKRSLHLLQQQQPSIAGRRTVTAQAAATTDRDAGQPQSQQSQDSSGRSTRRNPGFTNSGRQPLVVQNRQPRSNGGGATSGSDFDRALTKMDVDVKRSGRVTVTDFSYRLEDIKKLGKVSSQNALLMIRCCGTLLPELNAKDRNKLTDELWTVLQKSVDRLDISHYNALLKVYLENEHQFDPIAFLAQLEQKGIEPNRVTYQRLTAFYCQKGDIEGATKILEFMRAKDLPINESIFNVLIQGYARSGDMQSAEGVLDMMTSSQLEPSSVTYRTLLEAFGEKGDMESVRRIMELAKTKGIQLSDTDLFEIILAMVAKGHKANAGELIAQLRRTPGFIQDALNSSLRMVDHDASDIAFDLLTTVNVPKDLNDRSGFAAMFFRKMIRYGAPADVVWKYAEEIRAKQLNPWMFERILEAAFHCNQVEHAKEFLLRMPGAGAEVRPHYYWPLFAAYGKQGDIRNVFDLVASMNETSVSVTLETLTDFVLPALKGLSTDEIVDQFRIRFPGMSYVTPMMVYLLEQNQVQEAAKFLQGKEDGDINPQVISRTLAQSWINTKDLSAGSALLKKLAKLSSKGGQNDSFDAVGNFVLRILTASKGDEAVLEQCLRQLAKDGHKMSANAGNLIEARFQGRLPEKVGTLLDQVVGVNVDGQRFDDEFEKHPRNMGVDELEDHLQELTSKNMNTRGVLRRLLVEHARLRNVKRAEEIKAQLDQSNFEYSGAMYAQMMDMYTAQGDLDKALQLQKAARSVDKSFVPDAYKFMNLAALMIKKGKTDEAIQMLEDYATKYERQFEFDSLERNVFRILNAAAEAGDATGLKKLWQTLSTHGKLTPSNLICGPFVKVHVLKNDTKGAVEAFNECVEKYSQTPWKGELMKRLIEVEDTVSLQAVVDQSIKIHGESNSLYDLAFAFLEAGKNKQAQKIFDTPGLRARIDRLENFAIRAMENNRIDVLLSLLSATKNVFDVDRDILYYHLVRMFGKMGDPDRALNVWITMQEESLQPTARTLRALATVLKEHKREVPFAVPEEMQSQQSSASPEEQKLLNAIREDNPDAALQFKQELDSKDQPISVKGYSYLIELLLQKDRVKEAVNLTQEVLQQGNHPFPTVCKFLITKLSRAGDVATLEQLRPLFSEKTAAFLQLNKSIFNAYVNANRSEELLDRLEHDPDPDTTPVTGLLHMLRTSPNLLPRVEKLVDRYAEANDVRPVVSLWSYLFSERKFDESRRLLEKYPAASPRLRAISICERAHETNDIELLQKLVETLREHSRPNVALAYSYLIGLNCHNRDYNAALNVLQEARDGAGIELHEMRLSALRVLEKGLIQMGKPVPFEIPTGPRKQTREQEDQDEDEPVRERRAQ